MDFPYRIEGRRAPDRAPKLIASMRVRLDELARELGSGTDCVVVGGRSMGGRMASMLAAGGVDRVARADVVRPAVAVAGVVLISYPLHPPGKPDRRRVDHFADLRVPTLAISGTRDPFGTPGELEAGLSTIGGPVTLRWIDGARHDLAGADDEVAGLVADWLATL